MSLDGVEFVRRFLLHVLPKGFVRIRHFGFLANRAQNEKLARVRALIASERVSQTEGHDAPHRTPSSQPADALDRCPRCERGHMKAIEQILPQDVLVHDTS